MNRREGYGGTLVENMTQLHAAQLGYAMHAADFVETFPGSQEFIQKPAGRDKPALCPIGGYMDAVKEVRAWKDSSGKLHGSREAAVAADDTVVILRSLSNAYHDGEFSYRHWIDYLATDPAAREAVVRQIQATDNNCEAGSSPGLP